MNEWKECLYCFWRFSFLNFSLCLNLDLIWWTWIRHPYLSMNGREKEFVLMLPIFSSSFRLILIIYSKRHSRHRSAHEMSVFDNKYLAANVVVCQLYYYLLHLYRTVLCGAELFCLYWGKSRRPYTIHAHFCSLPLVWHHRFIACAQC